MKHARIGDMMTVGAVPPRLAKALAVISAMMHQSFDFNPRMLPGKSRESCVLSSLTVRDFLIAIGCANVRVRPVVTIMVAERDGKQLHSLGIGTGEKGARKGYWDGHLVVTADAFLIDTTLYYARRDAWPLMPGMVALPVQRGRRPMYGGLKPIAGLSLSEPEERYEFSMVWLDNPGNAGWERGPDIDPMRRTPVVSAMLGKFSAERAA